MNDKELLGFLYKPYYFYEIGYTKQGKFRRNQVIPGTQMVSFILDFEADDKFVLTCPSTGQTPRQDLLWDKIFLDFDTEQPSELAELKAEVDRFRAGLLSDFGIKPYIQFSGSKGYHVYIYFPEPFKADKQIIKECIKFLKLKYNLKYLCESCITGPVRLSRAPFTTNTKGKLCEPLDDLDEILTSTSICRLYKIQAKQYQKKQLALKHKREQRKSQLGDSDIFELDCRVVWDELYPELKIKEESNYYRSNCPWHASKSGNSVMVGEKVATCHHCGSFNAYAIVLRYFDGNVAKTMSKLKEIRGD